MSIIITLVAIVLMIVLHEWGHFIAGRICKTPINEFSIGMGPAIFQKKGKKETIYSLRLLPLGGYCAFDDNEENDNILNKLPVYKRIFIFFMGPLMNVIITIILFFCISFFIGVPTMTTTIEKVTDNFIYENIQPGDRIIEINGIKVDSYSQISETLSEEIDTDNPGQPLNFTLKRDNEIVTASITPQKTENGISTGILMCQEYKKISFGQSLVASAKLSWSGATMVFESIGGLITGKYKISDMSGIVGIVSIMGSVAKPSTAYLFFYFAAIISVNLGIMNLLPIPGLDGSKILFGVIEAIRKKPIPQNIEAAITMVSFGVLILLAVFITISDISKLIT